MSELDRESAPKQPDRWPVELADQAHVKDTSVAVVVNANSGLGLEHEGNGVSDNLSAVVERRDRPVMTLDWAYPQPRDLNDDPPGCRTDLLGWKAAIDQKGSSSGVADHWSAGPHGDARSVPEMIHGGVAYEDHIWRCEIVGTTRRKWIVCEERINKDAVRR